MRGKLGDKEYFSDGFTEEMIAQLGRLKPQHLRVIARNVRLVGDFRTRSLDDVYWDGEGEAMSRAFRDGAVFFKRFKFETDARLDYKLKIDGEYRLDPPVGDRQGPVYNPGIGIQRYLTQHWPEISG